MKMVRHITFMIPFLSFNETSKIKSANILSIKITVDITLVDLIIRGRQPRKNVVKRSNF